MHRWLSLVIGASLTLAAGCGGDEASGGSSYACPEVAFTRAGITYAGSGGGPKSAEQAVTEFLDSPVAESLDMPDGSYGPVAAVPTPTGLTPLDNPLDQDQSDSLYVHRENGKIDGVLVLVDRGGWLVEGVRRCD
jgi:hypothetical protein